MRRPHLHSCCNVIRATGSRCPCEPNEGVIAGLWDITEVVLAEGIVRAIMNTSYRVSCCRGSTRYNEYLSEEFWDETWADAFCVCVESMASLTLWSRLSRTQMKLGLYIRRTESILCEVNLITSSALELPTEYPLTCEAQVANVLIFRTAQRFLSQLSATSIKGRLLGGSFRCLFSLLIFHWPRNTKHVLFSDSLHFAQQAPRQHFFRSTNLYT